MLRRLALLVLAAALCAAPAMATTAADVLAKVRSAEAGVKDVRAEMAIESANKGNVSDMGAGYSDILKLQKGVISFKKPDKLRMDGYASGIKASFVQNGYRKLILAAMIRQTEDLTNKPGKRLDSLDFGFLSSRLWTDNKVTVVPTRGASGAKSSPGQSVVQLKLDPKSGGADKRHDYVWVDPKTLRVTKREKYTGDGTLRIRYVYTEFEMLAGKLPIATTSTMFGPSGDKLGTVTYRNVKANVGLADSIFSMSQR
jgi:outer membrane lipoprotein-sorting protein